MTIYKINLFHAHKATLEHSIECTWAEAVMFDASDYMQDFPECLIYLRDNERNVAQWIEGEWKFYAQKTTPQDRQIEHGFIVGITTQVMLTSSEINAVLQQCMTGSVVEGYKRHLQTGMKKMRDALMEFKI